MSRNLFLVALAMALTAVAIAAGTVVEVRGRPRALAVRSEPASLEGSLEATAARAPAPPPPIAILSRWDARRARAWARGDPRLLRDLYIPGSVAGRRDRAMVRAWAARGLVVRQLRTQLLSVRELAHRRSSWTLSVTDRLAGGVAVGAGVRRALPQDRATTRTVRLRRWAGQWRVASVTPGEVRP